MRLLALSNEVSVALVGVVGVVITTAGAVVVALLNRELGKRRSNVNRTMDDFEQAWTRRGELVEGLSADLDVLGHRLVAVEQREAECQVRLNDALARIAKLELSQ